MIRIPDMKEYKTRELKLMKAIKAAAKQPRTAEQVRKEKISFIIGALGGEDRITRGEIEAVLDEMEGTRSR